MKQKNKEETKQTKTALAAKLGVSRGMLYYRHKQPVTDDNLKIEIEKVLIHHPSYGHRRIALELSLNKKRIRRVMKKFHLMPLVRRSKKFVKPDDLGKPEAQFKNEIEGFCPIRPEVEMPFFSFYSTDKSIFPAIFYFIYAQFKKPL